MFCCRLVFALDFFLLMPCVLLLRLFPVLFYSSVVKSHEILTTDSALLGMETRGLITAEERALLLEMPGRQRHHAVIQWIGNVMVQACENDDVFHQR